MLQRRAFVRERQTHKEKRKREKKGNTVLTFGLFNIACGS
jgi:hypothetical protein